MKPRTTLWLISICLLLLGCGAYAQVTETHSSSGALRSTIGIFIGLSGLASVFLFPSFEPTQFLFQKQRRKVSASLLAIFLPAILARILLLPSAPSDDIHRYLWEGKLLNEGISPYSQTADHAVYKEHRDKHWEKMNHRDQPTAYPPLALRTFQFINKTHYHPFTYKLTFLALDLALISVLLAILKTFQLPIRWVGFYALSPLSLISYAGEAHFDILMVLPFCAAVLAHQKRSWWLCGLFLGLAVGMKCMMVVSIPFFFIYTNTRKPAELQGFWNTKSVSWQAVGGFMLALTLPLIGFFGQLIPILEAILLFGSSRSFNGPSYQLLEWFMPSNSRALPNLITLLLYILIWVKAARYALHNDLVASILWSFGGLVLLSPTVHFWYLAWILPFVCLRPHSFWLTLSMSGSLYFLVWHSQSLHGEWALPIWAQWAFWIPSLLTVSPKSLVSFFSNTFHRPNTPPKPQLSIIIPTLNPGTHLKDCLQSIPENEVSEIIIVDSSKMPPTLPQNSSAKLLSYPKLKGRGSQIMAGVQAASSDWVLVLHSDARLHPRATESLYSAIQAQTSLIGGCLGQRYDRTQTSLTLLESLNEWRATCFHTSYGDQTQFFHRQTALQYEALTAQPLMEDIEISQRLSRIGHTAYLALETTSDASKWSTTSIAPRFFSLLKLLLRYHILTMGSTSKKELLSHELYREYYPQKQG